MTFFSNYSLLTYNRRKSHNFSKLITHAKLFSKHQKTSTQPRIEYPSPKGHGNGIISIHRTSSARSNSENEPRLLLLGPQSAFVGQPRPPPPTRPPARPDYGSSRIKVGAFSPPVRNNYYCSRPEVHLHLPRHDSIMRIRESEELASVWPLIVSRINSRCRFWCFGYCSRCLIGFFLQYCRNIVACWFRSKCSRISI